MTGPVTTSTLECPRCGHREPLEMPTDACIVRHDCAGCGETLHPAFGNCCVFCSWGDVQCPPIQIGGRGCDVSE